MGEIKKLTYCNCNASLKITGVRHPLRIFNLFDLRTNQSKKNIALTQSSYLLNLINTGTCSGKHHISILNLIVLVENSNIGMEHLLLYIIFFKSP